MYSHVQIKALLNQVATNHKQINGFGLGDIWEAGASGVLRYPLMWAEVRDSSADAKQLRLSYSLYFMDRVDKGENSEDDVLSDQLRIAMDVLATLKTPSYEDLFIIDDSAPLVPFTEELDDEVSGWKMDVTFVVNHLSDRCSVPGDALDTPGAACEALLSTLSDDVLNTCILPSYDFSDVSVTNNLTAQQVIDLQNEICAAPQNATVKNSDNTYNVQVASGATLTLPDVTIKKSDLSTLASIASVKNYTVADSNVHNSTSSYNVNVKATETLILPDITFTDVDGVAVSTPSAVNVTATQNAVLPTSNLYIHLDAELGITLNGSNVSAWVDQSGNGINFAQSTGSSQPAYISSAINGRHALRFDGVDDYMTNTALSYNPDGTSVYLVIKPVAWANNKYIYYGRQASPAGDVHTIFMSGSTPGIKFACNNSIAGTPQKSFALSSYHMLQGLTNTTTEDFSRGIADATTFGKTTLSRIVNRLSIGGVDTAPGSFNSNFELAHLLVYTTKHTDVEKLLVLNWLRKKYAFI